MEPSVAEYHLAADLEELSRKAAQEVCTRLSDAIKRDGRASLVLCGGKTPSRLYTLLARQYAKEIDWDRVDFFWGDERYVDHSDEQSNFRLANQSLLLPLQISSERVHPMPTTFDNPAEAAASYERLLREYFRTPVPQFDVVLLGMGTDGHVASIFPGNKAPLEGAHLVDVAEAPVPPKIRLTLTLRSINAAASVFILVAGKEKREALERLRRPRERVHYPVSAVTGRNRLLWFVDREAAGNSGFGAVDG